MATLIEKWDLRVAGSTGLTGLVSGTVLTAVNMTHASDALGLGRPAWVTNSDAGSQLRTSALTLNKPTTILTRVYCWNSRSDDRRVFAYFKNGNGGGDSGISMVIPGGYLDYFRAQERGSAGDKSIAGQSITAALQEWELGLSFSDTQRSIYCNGTLTTSGDTASNTVDGSGTYLAFCGGWNGAGVYDGMSSNNWIDYAMVYDGVMTQAEIDAAFAAIDAAPDPILSGGATLDGLSASGSMEPQPASDLTGSATLDGLSAAGSMAMAPGTLTVPELRSWAGMLLTSQLVENIVVIRMSDRSLLCAFTNQTTDGSTANLALSHASLTAGTLCMVVGYNPDGSARFARPVTVV